MKSKHSQFQSVTSDQMHLEWQKEHVVDTLGFFYVSMCVWMYACIDVCIYECMYACKNACVYACIYVCKYIRM